MDPVNRRMATITLLECAEQEAAEGTQQHEDPPAPLEIAKAEAVTGFWRRLYDFAGLGVPRKGWREVGPAHPLLAVQGGRIRVQWEE